MHTYIENSVAMREKTTIDSIVPI